MCRNGLYQGRSIESFRNSMSQTFLKYMVQSSDGVFSVGPEIKKKMKFFEHNLFTPPKDKKQYDLILIVSVHSQNKTKPKKCLKVKTTYLRRNNKR